MVDEPDGTNTPVPTTAPAAAPAPAPQEALAPRDYRNYDKAGLERRTGETLEQYRARLLQRVKDPMTRQMDGIENGFVNGLGGSENQYGMSESVPDREAKRLRYLQDEIKNHKEALASGSDVFRNSHLPVDMEFKQRVTGMSNDLDKLETLYVQTAYLRDAAIAYAKEATMYMEASVDATDMDRADENGKIPRYNHEAEVAAAKAKEAKKEGDDDRAAGFADKASLFQSDAVWSADRSRQYTARIDEQNGLLDVYKDRMATLNKVPGL